MPQNDPAADRAIPPFVGADIVRLFTMTYLPLCRLLAAGGAIDPAALARRIDARLPPEETTAWSAVAQALAQVLRDDAVSTARG